MPDLGLPSPAELPPEPVAGERPSGRKALIRNVVTAAILGVAIAGLAWTFGQPGDAETSQAVTLTAKATGPAPRVGEPAPDFQVYQLDGTSVHLSDFRGRAVWLNFWATWCPPCRQEGPEIEAAYQKYRDAGVVILAIDMGEDPRTVHNYVQRAGLNYTVGIDQGTDIAAMYRVAGLPNHFFIDADGILREWRMGRLGQDKIDKSIAAILPAASAMQESAHDCGETTYAFARGFREGWLGHLLECFG